MQKGIYNFSSKNKFILILIIIVTIFLVIHLVKGFIGSEELSTSEIITYIIIIVLGIISSFKLKKENDTYNEIIEQGKRVSGTIIKPIKEMTPDSDAGYNTEYYLIVKYLDPNTNQELEFKTDQLSFNPFKKLQSNRCSVYILGDKITASDFEFTSKKEECIFKDQEEGPPKNMKIDFLFILIIMIILIVLFLIASIALLL